MWLAVSAASAIGSSWVIMLVGRRWQPDPGWSDRLGRLLAVVWLVTLAVDIILYLIIK